MIQEEEKTFSTELEAGTNLGHLDKKGFLIYEDAPEELKEETQ